MMYLRRDQTDSGACTLQMLEDPICTLNTVPYYNRNTNTHHFISLFLLPNADIAVSSFKGDCTSFYIQRNS